MPGRANLAKIAQTINAKTAFGKIVSPYFAMSDFAFARA